MEIGDGQQLYVERTIKTLPRPICRRRPGGVKAAVRAAFKRAGVDMMSLSTEEDLVRAIVRFAELRRQRRR